MNSLYNKFPLIIAGSRDFRDIKLMLNELRSYCEERNLKPSDIQFVSGGAEGADKMGEFLAEYFGSDIKRYIPDWERYGQTAGMQRNEKMAQYVSKMNGGCIVFWNGVSNGSKHMIKMSKEYSLDYKVVNYVVNNQ